jgi:hypothetical protein
MVIYSDATPVRQARAEYFRANGFGDDGGYDAQWVKVKLGAVPLWFPNTDARRRAVRLHDLHHLATGYETSLVGEAEIDTTSQQRRKRVESFGWSKTIGLLRKLRHRGGLPHEFGFIRG